MATIRTKKRRKKKQKWIPIPPNPILRVKSNYALRKPPDPMQVAICNIGKEWWCWSVARQRWIEG